MSQLALVEPNGIFFSKLRHKISHKGLFLKAVQNIKIGTLHITLPCGKAAKLHGNSLSDMHADIQIHDNRFFKAVMQKGNIGMAESYRDGWVSSSNMVSLLRLAVENQSVLDEVLRGKWYGKALYKIKHWQNRNNKTGSKKNIHAHYDLGNQFYKLWLDDSMTYSSALFLSEKENLYDAQQNKYARIFEKAKLKAGDTVLEIGCGWGGFAEYAAKKQVRVVGVSLSKEQLSYAKLRLAQQNLDHLCDLRYQDYRDIPETNFDAVVSIEMIEAVGVAYWDSYFNCLHEKVKSGGAVVLQAITIANDKFEQYKNSTDFIQQYIFPGGMLPSPKVMKSQLSKHHFALADYMEFGKDYAKTLALWQADFESTLVETKKLGFDESFIKLWRFYYEYCQAGFLAGSINVCHVQAIKNKSS